MKYSTLTLLLGAASAFQTTADVEAKINQVIMQNRIQAQRQELLGQLKNLDDQLVVLADADPAAAPAPTTTDPTVTPTTPTDPAAPVTTDPTVTPTSPTTDPNAGTTPTDPNAGTTPTDPNAGTGGTSGT